MLQSDLIRYVGQDICSGGVSLGPQQEKTCLRGFANNKGTDQPAHLCRLISDFVIRSLESISKFATGNISIF